MLRKKVAYENGDLDLSLLNVTESFMSQHMPDMVKEMAQKLEGKSTRGEEIKYFVGTADGQLFIVVDMHTKLDKKATVRLSNHV